MNAIILSFYLFQALIGLCVGASQSPNVSQPDAFHIRLDYKSHNSHPKPMLHPAAFIPLGFCSLEKVAVNSYFPG